MSAALLALVADDRLAQQVLAIWISMRLPASTPDSVIADRVVGLGVAATTTAVVRAVRRLRAAELIVDGGTTDLGDRWLQTVAAALMAGQKGSRRR